MTFAVAFARPDEKCNVYARQVPPNPFNPQVKREFFKVHMVCLQCYIKIFNNVFTLFFFLVCTIPNVLIYSFDAIAKLPLCKQSCNFGNKLIRKCVLMFDLKLSPKFRPLLNLAGM